LTRANLPVVDVGAVLLNVPRKNLGLENVALPKVREESPVELMGLVNNDLKEEEEEEMDLSRPTYTSIHPKNISSHSLTHSFSVTSFIYSFFSPLSISYLIIISIYSIILLIQN